MKIRLILGDQLNEQHSWFSKIDNDVVYVLFEMRQETDYVKHHVQKVIAFFSAMRNFNETLKAKGHRTHYLMLDDKENRQELKENLLYVFQEHRATHFEYLLPDEYRLDKQLNTFCKTLSIPSKAHDTEHFMSEREELTHFFQGKKKYIMEFFYRNMRRKFNLLMVDGQPEGGEWNYDKSNRKKWKGTPAIPMHYIPKTEGLEQIHLLLKKEGITTLGEFNPSEFLYPTGREEALQQLRYFCKHLLIHFGDYQDALHTDEVNLFHSRISFALNTKMISPLEVVTIVIGYYRKNKAVIELSQVEGFVRQIIGWREYMRGIYWKEMPEYAQKNTLENTRALPDFYWNGNTKMNCLKHSINNSLNHGYAHHIQRLMILGNFALLAQVHPNHIDKWFLGIYADAVEWVQLPNTRGMSQWADGGIVATKPYISAAAYINKMSNYCGECSYDKSKRIGENACPFNSLYWNFLDDKKSYFLKNNRMAMMLRLLEKIPVEELAAIKERAANILTHPDNY